MQIAHILEDIKPFNALCLSWHGTLMELWLVSSREYV
jgi:hypothetical protein